MPIFNQGLEAKVLYTIKWTQTYQAWPEPSELPCTAESAKVYFELMSRIMS